MADVLRLPTAAAAPVVQQPRRGRFPKSVLSFRDGYHRRWARQFETSRETELKRIQDQINEHMEAVWELTGKVKALEC